MSNIERRGSALKTAGWVEGVVQVGVFQGCPVLQAPAGGDGLDLDGDGAAYREVFWDKGEDRVYGRFLLARTRATGGVDWVSASTAERLARLDAAANVAIAAYRLAREAHISEVMGAVRAAGEVAARVAEIRAIFAGIKALF